MKLPHWLRCAWAKWSEPTLERYGMFDVRTLERVGVGEQYVQVRTCQVCGKLERRTVQRFQ